MVSVFPSSTVDCGVMVSVFSSSTVDCGVMVSVFSSSTVDCGVMVSVFSSTTVDCGVMVSVFSSSTVDCGFELRSGQTKDYKIGICGFSDKHTAFRRKSKDWLARNQNNVSERSDMSIRRLMFRWASTIKKSTKHVDLLQSVPHHHHIENYLVPAMMQLENCWVGVKQQSITPFNIYTKKIDSTYSI